MDSGYWLIFERGKVMNIEIRFLKGGRESGLMWGLKRSCWRSLMFRVGCLRIGGESVSVVEIGVESGIGIGFGSGIDIGIRILVGIGIEIGRGVLIVIESVRLIGVRSGIVVGSGVGIESVSEIGGVIGIGFGVESGIEIRLGIGSGVVIVRIGVRVKRVFGI